LEKELGWQSHTVRAAICGLRKNGVEIETGKTKSGQTIYRLIPADGKAGAGK
jgi:biotin operon repressor